MKKLLVICGPTATGKTKLGLKLARKFEGEIISADSRQVYRGMDIGTGKGLPQNATLIKSPLLFNRQPLSSYLVSNIKIWGYDLVAPNQDFSTSQFVKFAEVVIKDIWQRNKLPILVGGTGLYLKALTQPLLTTSTPPNWQLRKRYADKSVVQLQAILAKVDAEKLKSMNQSDRQNPRRLIRAIEIAQHPPLRPKTPATVRSNQLWIGLRSNLQQLDKLIAQNVKSRATKAFTKEIAALESAGFNWSWPAASATGYRQWKDYLDGRITKKQAIKLWVKAETQYARRQLTWFKKQPQILWFDIIQPNFYSQVEQQVQDWYS